MSYGIWLNENSDNRIDLWVPRATLEKKGKLATDNWHLQPYTYTTDVNTHYKLIAMKKEKSCYDQEFKPEPPPKNRQRKKEECKWLCRVHSIVLYWTAEVLLKTPRSSTTCTRLLEGLYYMMLSLKSFWKLMETLLESDTFLLENIAYERQRSVVSQRAYSPRVDCAHHFPALFTNIHKVN